MNPHDEPDQELPQAYERASSSDAGKPSDATRRAIMAEATAASRRRTPAANDARYVWRAIAGVAVFGIALLLWRQSNPPTVLTTAQSVTLPASSATEVADAAQPAETPAATVESKAPSSARAKSAPSSAERVVAQERVEVQEQLQPSPRAFVEDRSAEQARGAMAAAAPATEAAGAPAREVPTSNWLRAYFPQLMNSWEPGSVWIVFSSDGQVQRSGQLTPPETLNKLAPGPWERLSVTNSRGQRIDIAVYRVPAP